MTSAYLPLRKQRANQIAPDGALAAYLKGKRVVMVGPSGYLTGLGQGPEIDAYDVVVRLNLDCPIRPDLHERLYPGRPHPDPGDVGTRTDLLYHTLFSISHTAELNRRHTPQEVALWREDGLQFLIARQEYASERVQRFLRVAGELPVVLMPQKLIARVRHGTHAIPNTGVLAIAHLLSLPIASLYVTGFSFYTHGGGYRVGYGGFTAAEAAKGNGTGHWGQVKTLTEVPHAQAGQMEFLRRLWREDRRLSFDAYPHEALELPGNRPPGITAIVPIKRHSERLPGKNWRLFAGKPLLYWVLAELHRAANVGMVVVDTDDDEIEAMVRTHSPRTLILRDGEHVNANTIIASDLPRLEGEHFGQFHVTSPLLTAGMIDRAIELYFESLDEHDSLFAVTRHHSWFFREDGTPLHGETRTLPRSQDLPPLFEDNSAIHLFSRASFEKTRSRIGERPQMFEIPVTEAIDINHAEDFELAEAVMERRLRHA